MSPRLRLEEGEATVISVTPVAEGLLGPLIVLVLLEGVIIAFAPKWSLLHHYEAFVILVVGFVPALVIVGRSWRWRSHKVIVTTRRVVMYGGVLSRYSTEIDFREIVATHATQSWRERVRRRGTVLLDLPSGTVALPPVRQPAALRRLIDRTRRDASSASRDWEQWLHDPSTDNFGDDSFE